MNPDKVFPTGLQPKSLAGYTLHFFMVVTLGCAAHSPPSNHAQDVRPAEPELTDTLRAPPAPEPLGWNTTRSSGLGFRSRPHATSRVPMPGPVESLATDGAHIFVVAGGVAAMVASNVVAWKFPETVSSLSYVPALSGGSLWLSREHELLLVRPESGTVVQRIPSAASIKSAVKPDGDAVVWLTQDGVIHSTAGWTAQGLTSASGSVAVAGGNILDKTVVYAASLDGALIAADSGGERWRARLPGPAVGAPMVGPDGVFVAVAGINEPGGIVAVRVDGSPMWQTRTVQTPSLPPAMGPDGAGGWTIYLADRNGKLSALNESSGQERWNVEVGGAISAMSVMDDVVLVGAADGVLYAVEASDGGVRWRVEVGTITAAPLPVAGKIWIGLAEGALIALEE